MEEMSMYKHFRDVRNLAETITNYKNTIETIDMGPWGNNSERICITGKTEHGERFELSLEIEKQEVTQDGT
jgi:hypothetical protein